MIASKLIKPGDDRFGVMHSLMQDMAKKGINIDVADVIEIQNQIIATAVFEIRPLNSLSMFHRLSRMNLKELEEKESN